MLIDTHCHLDFPEFEADRGEVIQRAFESGIGFMVNVGSSLENSRNSLELAKEYSCVYAAVGVHPHEADSAKADTVSQIKEMALASDKVKAIGEIGLDYYRNFSSVSGQRDLFIRQLTLAKELNLPVIIHSREAAADTLSILKQFLPLKGLIHCFSGDESFLKSCLDMGFGVSFTCNVTYKKAQDLRDVLKLAPLGSLMLETDCPYLSPEGFRGKRNEPLQVKLLAEYTAKIKEVSFTELAEKTTNNAKKFFGIV